MLVAYLIFALCAIFLLVALGFYLAPSAPKVTSVPGPIPSDKNDGNLGDIVQAGSLHEFLEDLHDEYGPVASFWWGVQNVISVASASFFKEQAKFFDRPVALFEFLAPLVSEHSIQFANGTEGKMRREKYDRYFTTDACEDYISALWDIASEMAVRWEEKFKEPGDHVPIHKFMTAYSVRCISSCCFGDMDHKDLVEMSDEYSVAMDGLMRRWTGPVYPEDDPREKRFEQSVARIKKIIGKVVKARISALKSGSGGKGEGKQCLFLDGVIDTTNERQDLVDITEEKKEELILADAMTYFVGGFHTTANLLAFCLYYLAKHPDLQQRAREELICVLGDDPVQQHVNPSNYSKLVYCRAVLDETLRCAKIAPMAARCSDREHNLGQHVIPPFTPVIHALGVSLDDPEFFPDPEEFDPERFLPENRENRPSLAFVPFGFAGKRKCPAFRFAYLEAIVLLAVLLRKFRLRLVDDELEVVPQFGFVSKPKEEIFVFLDAL